METIVIVGSVFGIISSIIAIVLCCVMLYALYKLSPKNKKAVKK